jgi:hypothetical protein
MRGTEWRSIGVLAVAVFVAAACAKSDPDSRTAPPASSVQGDSETVARLEGEARALARTDGCTFAGQCMTAPVGERACGGPREHLVYCARTTDTATLHRRLAELRQAEMALNQQTGAVSTCEFREPPPTQLVAGACQAR